LSHYVVGAVVLAIMAYGAYHFARYRRDQGVEARIDRFNGLIARQARAQGLEPALVRAVIRCESAGEEHAVSAAGARGLMQLMPATEKELLRLRKISREGDLEDPEFNIRVGTLYLRMMLDRFGHDVLLAVAAYNMGPTRLAELRAAHPELSPQELVDTYAPDETIAYCRRVLEWRGEYQTARPDTGDRKP
jgi:soluble lytic murein transglycosylase